MGRAAMLEMRGIKKCLTIMNCHRNSVIRYELWSQNYSRLLVGLLVTLVRLMSLSTRSFPAARHHRLEAVDPAKVKCLVTGDRVTSV